MSLCGEYLEWIERLGWVTRPMLTTLTRPAAITEDKNLDKYLNRWQREGKVRRVRFGRRSVYSLAKYGTGRQPNIWHGVMSAQSVVYLWKQFLGRERVILTPADFIKGELGVIPDFGLSVRFSDGVHLFLIEYQTQAEAGRSTLKKINAYATCLEDIRSRFHAVAVWVLVVVRRERLWVGQFAQEVGQSFVYLIDTQTFFNEPNVAWCPLFFTARGGQMALVDSQPGP